MKRRMGPMSNQARYALSVLEANEYGVAIESAVDQLDPKDRDAVNACATSIMTYFMVQRSDALHLLARMGLAGR